jgi:hypothetical protein
MTDEYREYESGVADVLSYVLGPEATVQRDVRLPSRSGPRKRQVDVLVRGRLFGLDDATLAVECKRWKRKITVGDAERFLAFLDDIRADLGLLVTTVGYSPAAQDRLQHERGTRGEIVTLDELAMWSPAGTIHVAFRLPASDSQRAASAFRAAGLRVRPDDGLAHAAGEVILEVFGHFGGGADQRDQLCLRATAALVAAGLPVDIAASGVSIGGGTPAHRWLEVTDRAGVRLGVKVLADTEEEVQRQLARVAGPLGVTRESLDVDRPDDWPVSGLFGLRG